MMRFYAPFITEVTPQVTMALRSERAMVRLRQKYRGVSPNMTWGRALENTLTSKGIYEEFKERMAIAKDSLV